MQNKSAWNRLLYTQKRNIKVWFSRTSDLRFVIAHITYWLSACYKRPPFTLQKVTFQAANGYLLRRNWRHIRFIRKFVGWICWHRPNISSWFTSTPSSKRDSRISRHPELDSGSSRMSQRCQRRLFPFRSWIKFRMNDVSSTGWRNMRAPHLDEDVRCSCNLNVIKQFPN